MSIKISILLIFISTTFQLNGMSQINAKILMDNLNPVNSYGLMGSPKELNVLHVFIFYSPDCPICIKHTKTLKDMVKQFSQEKISYYLIFPGIHYSKSYIRKFQKKYQFQLPAFLDENYRVSKAFNATVTPEVFVTDSNYEILYSGKIDNWFENIGVRRKIITEHYLKDAILSGLKGIQPIIRRTEPVGCFINY